jgi:16S rRNA C1402 (ribose-2'-O) methylase RsmI
MHEEMVRGTLRELSEREGEWRGEIVIVLGAHAPASREETIDDDALDKRIDEALASGQHAKTIADRLAAWSGRPRREVYERVVTRKSARSRADEDE